ncbi:MAG: Trk system potassium transporter TrkA [Micavibrio aeruginosavorus]|uniref:Trk system potassium uptake protein TrkA n=1 Tax=Micavibrio aeruginosavorus TaxID=349221 RepID=A0A7T5UG20_9BACT|nr:MAG: Trk system potassium transporter TrkA [Micavibrio aeruginosavorus]
MRVIICGAGQVGLSIARYLSREDNDVTLIDIDVDKINQARSDLDAQCIRGQASSPDVLSSAGASDADMIIAVTNSDEVNMLACQVGHSLFNIPKKIARIRNQSYLDPAWSNLFSRAHMPIDVIISPEIEIANSIVQRLLIPGTTNVALLADGRVYLIGVIVPERCPVMNVQIRQLNTLFPDLSLVVGSIHRHGEIIVPTGEDRLEPGDEVFFFVDPLQINRALSAFGHEEKQARNIVLIGGGNVGYYLARKISSEFPQINIKIIEHNKERANFLASNLPKVIVLQGDALHQDLIEGANIAQAETAITVTNNDESNILGAALAKQAGAKRAIALVNGTTYSSLTSLLEIDAVVSPRASTVSTIMRHVRRGRIKALQTLGEGHAEVIEAEVSETSFMTNKTIHDLDLPEDIRICGIIRNGKIMSLSSDLVIKPHDHVIVLTSAEEVRRVEQMFMVQVDLF